MDVYGAIADPIRRRLLEAMCFGPCSVSDLVLAVGYHQPGVSRHLRVLLDAGLVQAQPDGKHRIYSLCLAPFLELEAWTQHHIKSFGSRLDRLGGLIEEGS